MLLRGKCVKALENSPFKKIIDQFNYYYTPHKLPDFIWNVISEIQL